MVKRYVYADLKNDRTGFWSSFSSEGGLHSDQFLVDFTANLQERQERGGLERGTHGDRLAVEGSIEFIVGLAEEYTAVTIYSQRIVRFKLLVVEAAEAKTQVVLNTSHTTAAKSGDSEPYGGVADWSALYAGRLYGPRKQQGVNNWPTQFADLVAALPASDTDEMPVSGSLVLFKDGAQDYKTNVTGLTITRTPATSASSKVVPA